MNPAVDAQPLTSPCVQPIPYPPVFPRRLYRARGFGVEVGDGNHGVTVRIADNILGGWSTYHISECALELV
jgi:hypothetical protein